MSLNPLDLQTMYSQINNVAKQASHLTQGAQLSQSMQQEEAVRKNQEEAKKVSETKENSQAKGIDVNSDGKNSNTGHQNSEKKSADNPYEQNDSDKIRIKEEYLGKHIDITR